MINFFCIGTQKSGTTTLHDILSQHPDIFLSEQKETHFFCRTDFYNKGYDWYKKSYFKNANDIEYIGEIDPDYLFFEKTIERIAENCSVSDTKFIVVLRNPVDRHHVNAYFSIEVWCYRCNYFIFYCFLACIYSFFNYVKACCSFRIQNYKK